MIYSLNTFLEPTAKRVLHNTEPVAYSWGDVDALHKWIESMNKKQLNKLLGVVGGRKYPLIWLVEGWQGKQENSWINFTNVTFYIAVNSEVSLLNKNRQPMFDKLYSVANDFIKQLKNDVAILDETLSFVEKASFNTKRDVFEQKSFTADIWDILILSMDLRILNKNNCFNH